MRLASLTLLLAALAPLRAAAQPVVGVVAEEGTGTPVPGAMVILFDSAGTQVGRVLSNAAGRFLIHAQAPGSHYITVERIGYANWTTDRFEPGAGAGLITIRVPVEAIPLEGLDVSSGRRCEVRPEEGAATARVWEEVRKALSAEDYTREASLYAYTLFRYNRQLDRDAREILVEDTTIAENLPAAFRSFPIDELAEWGFVQAAEDTTTIYFAPDAGALISDVFLDTHCFGLREGEEGRIGLIFRPVEGRVVPEIGGVLWVDAATSELERLEFVYLNLLRSREVGEPGGEVAFTRLPDGAWIVREWRIRMPNLEPARRGRVRRTGYTEEGGVTWAVTDWRSRTVLHADSASISGVVTDSAGTGPPTVPLVVQHAGTGRRVMTEEDGSFLLTGVKEGRNEVLVQSSLLANWGLASPSRVVAEGRLGEVVHVRMRGPSIPSALSASCGGAPRPGGTAAFLGRITTPEGAPASDMRVGVRWLRASGYSVSGISAPRGPEGTEDRSWQVGRDGMFATATTITDWRGLFMLCDVPSGSRLRVSVMGPAGDEPVFRETLFVPPEVPAVVENVIPGAGNRRSIVADRMESAVDSLPTDSTAGTGRNAVTASLLRFAGDWEYQETRMPSGEGIQFQFADGRGIPPPELITAVTLEARKYARRLKVGVGDSLLAFSGDGWALDLPLDGSERSVVQDSTGVQFSVGVTWSGDTLVVLRSFGDQGAVFDGYAITEDDLLVITRTARLGPQEGRNSVQFVYLRSAPAAPPPGAGSAPTPTARRPPRR
ncbi:MAG: carboxypeptidase-like regulatory domain-containing protein [Gemmatimonadota bacterium]|nr:carboxypeptidase-like regulatory domain-containing protein [Gemmatimonadota bacterium]